MLILPAIDIIDRKPVRLYQGDYAQKEIVGSSVMELAKNFEQSGAEYIHLVDLDGAKEGKRVNHEIILETAHALDVPVEVGGGIRTMAQIESYLENGIDRVIRMSRSRTSAGTGWKSSIRTPSCKKGSIHSYTMCILIVRRIIAMKIWWPILNMGR